MTVRRILVLSLTLLAGCSRSLPPAPYVLHDSGPAAAVEPLPNPGEITVANGDTLYGVAQRYGVPVRAIIDANRLQPPYRLYVGQSLVLPQVKTHLVRAGDTLALVARRYGVDMSTLAAVNHLSPPYVIRTGELLVLPAPVAVAQEPPPRPRPVPAKPRIAVAVAPPPAVVARAEAPPRPPPVPAQPAVAQPAPPPAAPPSPPPQVAENEPPPRAAPEPLPPAGDGGEFRWPVTGRIIAAFGAGADGTQNDGINIAAPAGTTVLAAAAGEVAYAGNELKGYGNLILIKHPDGFITAYADNSVLLVKRGEIVARGQPIARVGATGAVTEPQLHFEIRRGTRALDPVQYLPAEAAAAK